MSWLPQSQQNFDVSSRLESHFTQILIIAISFPPEPGFLGLAITELSTLQCNWLTLWRSILLSGGKHSRHLCGKFLKTHRFRCTTCACCKLLEKGIAR